MLIDLRLQPAYSIMTVDPIRQLCCFVELVVQMKNEWLVGFLYEIVWIDINDDI